jgi:hypothetical protein
MQFKHIKPVLLIIFIFCTLSSMASKREYRVHSVSDLTAHDSRAIGVDDYNLSGPPILSEFSRTAKPIKLILVSPANVYNVTLCLNIPERPGNAYVISGCPFKTFNRLLLFPFHGFW